VGNPTRSPANRQTRTQKSTNTLAASLLHSGGRHRLLHSTQSHVNAELRVVERTTSIAEQQPITAPRHAVQSPALQNIRSIEHTNMEDCVHKHISRFPHTFYCFIGVLVNSWNRKKIRDSWKTRCKKAYIMDDFTARRCIHFITSTFIVPVARCNIMPHCS
jgi:hypothetical protein